MVASIQPYGWRSRLRVDRSEDLDVEEEASNSIAYANFILIWLEDDQFFQLSLVHELMEAIDWRKGKGNDSLAKGKGSHFRRRKLIEKVEKKE